MDYRTAITAKVRSRTQFPGTSLREIQLIEDLYGETHITYDPTQVLAYNNAFTNDVHFPLKRYQQIKK